ncbi:MAG TPA: hypothetical protein VGI23_04510, partial [Steroidobacteraceae bacterium]
ANTVLDQVTTTGAVVPALWKLETANGLQIAIRRQRVDASFRERALLQLARLPITIDVDPTPTRGRRPCSLRTVFSSPFTMQPI